MIDDLDYYCSNKDSTAAVVTQKLRGEGATVEECIKAAKEFNKLNPKKDGSPRVWGEKKAYITSHISWLRREHGITVEQEGNTYKVIEHGSIQQNDFNGSDKNFTQEAEMAIKAEKRKPKEVPDKFNIYDFFKSKDFFFTKEILTRYFLALKTKPFVILTGISGTGKTKIAQIFADYICQDESSEEKEKRIAFVPVRPDWMDNKGLLGFYNILDEKYHATPFLKLLLEADQNPDKPYFVILDEMNLAKVEQYFSDFLSIMESRTADRKRGEKIPLHSLKTTLTEDGQDVPNEIHIPPNVFFTGTVNVDETTYMFSPKVLDRANVLEFNEVDLDKYLTGVTSQDRFRLSNSDVRNGMLTPDDEPFCSKKDYVKLVDIIEKDNNPIAELLNILKKYNLHFGYRVVNEISRFICLSKEFLENFSLNEAIDIQILQKILPKFHGTQGKLEEPLRDIFYFCYDNTHQNGTIPDEMLEKAAEFDEKAIFPRSYQKIARMIKNLKSQGYTSFIE